MLILYTENPPKEARVIAEIISANFKVEDSGSFMMRAAGADLPQWIQITGEAIKWAPLVIFAKKYLEQLAIRAGNDTYDWLTTKLDPKNKNPFTELVASTSIAIEKGNGNFSVQLALPIPAKYYGTILTITSSDKEDIAYKLAVFLTNAQEIEQVSTTISNNNKSLSPFLMKIDTDRIHISFITMKGEEMTETIRLEKNQL